MRDSIAPKETATEENTECVGCGNWERRQFVQSAVGSVAALLGLSLFGSTEAAAQIFPLNARADSATGATNYPIPATDGVSIDTTNYVILARADNKVYAFALSCPHQNTSLRWNAKDHRFQCPKHKSRYAASGEFLDGRATRNMDRLPIKLEANAVAVDTVHEIRSDQDAAKWASAFVQLTA
ncbi:MAG: Rieske (2Fe-2S) protein [Gemmatimonadaceae bacterium]